jgi:hypothetical protein
MSKKINFVPKYYSDVGKKITNHVFFTTFDTEGNLLDDEKDSSCFSSLTYCPITPLMKSVVIKHSLSKIPYNNDIIVSWIKDLNELGFPCSVVFDANDAFFTVKPKDFTKKLHFSSTLQLIRALYERYICYAPDIYFGLISGEKPMDKFEAIQIAHLKIGDYKESTLANWNHMITSPHVNSKPITREEFNSRLEKSDYDMAKRHWNGTKHNSLNGLWCGDEKPEEKL